MKFQRNLIKKVLIFAFAFNSFAASAVAAGCDLAVPQLVGAVGSETREGNGYWEPGWFPLTGDKPCEEEQEGRGIRYKKATTRFTTTFKMLSGEWVTMKHFSEYEAGADSYTETNSHWSSYDGYWPGSPTEISYSSFPEWQSQFQRPEADWKQSRYELNESRSSAVLSQWNNGPEHYGSGTDYILGGAFGITIANPVTTHNVHYSSEKLLDGRWRSTTIKGRISTCPGKYKVTLYYVESPGGEEQSIEEEFEFADQMPVDGYPVSMPLPTTECKRTDYVRMEYVALDSCSETPPPPGSGGSSNKSVMSITHLGRKRNGGNAGSLYLHKPSISTDVFSPASMQYLAPAGSGADAVIRSEDGALRQLRMPEFLVDITPITIPATPAAVTSGYQIAFYPLSMVEDEVDSVTGTYPLKSGASPSYTKRHDNPDAPTIPNVSATKLRITSQHAGGSPQVDLFENVTGGVSLSLANGQKRVVKTTSVSGSDTTTTEQSFAPATATVPDLVSSTVTRNYSFGRRIVEESQGTGTTRVWTSHTYDDTASSSTYGLLKLKQSSNGAWERYDYYSNKDLRYTWSPLTDADSTTTTAALLKCVEQVKTSVIGHLLYGNGELLTTIETRGGVEIARSHEFTKAEPETIFIGTEDTTGVLVKHKIESQATHPGTTQAWDGAGNLLTHSYYALSGEDSHEVLRKDSPDGTILLVRHSGSSTTSNTMVEIWEGQPNAERTDIVAGTRAVTEQTHNNFLVSKIVRDVATESSGVRNSGLVISEEQYSDHDVVGRPQTIVYLDGSTETRSYNTCCGKLTSSSRNGVTTNYGYDSLGRIEWEKVEAGSGASLQTLSHFYYTYDSQGRVLTRSRVPYSGNTSGAAQLLERNIYDDAGTLLSTAAPGSVATDTTLTRVTTYGSIYDTATGRTTRTVTLPGGATEITVTDRAGRTLSRTGTAVAPVRYEYGTATFADAADWGLDPTASLSFTREIKLDAAGADTLEIVTTYSDFLGLTIKTVYGDGAATRSFYDLAGRLVRQTDPDGVQTLRSYTAATATTGEIQVTALDIDRDGVIDYNGTDRVTRQANLVATRTDGVTYTVRRGTTEVWETDGSATPTSVSIVETTPDGLRSWQIGYGLTTVSVTTYDGTTGERTDTVTLPDNTQQVSVALAGRSVSSTKKTSSGGTVSKITYGYDAFGRLETETRLGVGTTTTTYYADDQPHTVTTPDPNTTRSGPGYDPQTTTYFYDAAGRASLISHPDATSTWTTHWLTGAVKRTWGSRTYPVDYTYDAQGRVKTLTTYQNFGTSELLRTAVTTWNYSPTRGWLINKRYTDNTGPDYDYWPSGRLKTRDWARSVSGTRLRTTYTYNNAGDLWTVDYADATPDVTHTYDRVGRLKTTTDAAGVLTRGYEKGRLDDETYAAGTAHLSGRAITRSLDTLGRPATLAATSLSTFSYGYDTAGRLSTIAQDSRLATLGYKPQVGTHQSTAITIGTQPRYGMTRTIDALGRITRVDTTMALALQARRDYTYDAANQRTEVVHEDALRWAYGYDALGQVNSAQKQNASGVLLPGYDQSYVHDTIGNRVSTTTNGRLVAYAPDLRNQYVSRTVPAAFDVLGSAPLDVNVMVDGAVAARGGESFHGIATVNNTAAPAFGNVDILAARPGNPDQVASESRGAWVAKNPENYVYDLDGNLTQDGRWTYVWDAENRLVEMTPLPEVITVGVAAGLTPQKLRFDYDSRGRRIRKQVYVWTGGTWAGTPTTDLRFVYDGWNLLVEYNALASNVIVRSHAWGLDLSGTPQGGGGVGGLLWTRTATANYAPAWDANGNIIAWIDFFTNTLTGRRDYGAFGEPLAATGNAASLPFAFSTKYRDSETELYYYGFRYYNPSTGRWLGRDPINEKGAKLLQSDREKPKIIEDANPYHFVFNSPTNAIDPLGLSGIPPGWVILQGVQGLAGAAIFAMDAYLLNTLCDQLDVGEEVFIQTTGTRIMTLAGRMNPAGFMTTAGKTVYWRVRAIRNCVCEYEMVVDMNEGGGMI